METVYDFSVKLTDGKDKPLRVYEGKTLLIVNTASKCGFAPQLEELESLYKKYTDDGFEILGFPCDQFKNQEFSNIEETVQFCQKNYGVTFQIFAKINVNGEEEHPLYTFLKEQKGGVISKNIKWNFTKFLVDWNGQVVERYSPTTKPSKIEEEIVKVLGK